VRPRCEAPRMPRHSIFSRWVDDEPVAKRAHASVKPVPSLTGVRSPPLHRVRPLDILNFGREGPRPSFGPVVLTFVPGSGR